MTRKWLLGLLVFVGQSLMAIALYQQFGISGSMFFGGLFLCADAFFLALFSDEKTDTGRPQ